jgi:glycosidase
MHLNAASQHRVSTLIRLGFIGTCLCVAASATARVGALHVPSPDWRDQVIYFLMTDRFDDGDPGNNDQGAGEYDPSNRAKYSGGDLRGLSRRLDYIQGLGATAVWITPPVAVQWWDAGVGYGGYHGYWASDFTAVDPHLGTLDDYRALSRALHGRGMYLVQDIVLNHVGNYFRYPGEWSPDDPTLGWTANPDSTGRRAPVQPPFDRNDPRDPAQRAASIYHWTPTIRDVDTRREELTFQLADLDDLDTGNPVVRDALRRSYGHWIREVGVDAFRIDTVFYVEPDAVDDFVYGGTEDAPGVMAVARATGRESFHVFGEGFGIDVPFADTKARKIERYMRGAAGGSLPGMINFPLYGTTLDVFARGAPTAALGHRIRSMMALHARAHWMPTFVDNHDVDRFLAGGSDAALRQSLLLIMTLPGIPTIYYGTEQGFTRPREAMFAAGWGADGRDRFDTEAPLYRFLAAATALRRENRVFSRGTPTVLHESAAGPGAFAYRMAYEQATALVVFNSADAPALLDNLDTGLAPGTRLEPAFAIDGEAPVRVVDARGRIDVELPMRAGLVWLAQPATAGADTAQATGALEIDPIDATPVPDDFAISGTARGVGVFSLVIDGELSRAIAVQPGADGRWQARIDTASMVDPAVSHRVVAWSAAQRLASAPATFRVARRWAPLARIEDPAGDDHGPRGTYHYPTDPSWGENRQMDLRAASAEGSGGALRLSLDLNRVTTSWSPANGFDHVAFGIYIAFPGEAGGQALPLRNAPMPDALRWQYALRAHGWSNAMFAAGGADARNEGRPLTPGAALAADRAANRVSFTFPAAALGNRRSLSGARVYVTTWDYDGGWRGLTPEPGSHTFGGGDGARDPLVMDELLVVIP